jgi:general secretion pathway protein D
VRQFLRVCEIALPALRAHSTVDCFVPLRIGGLMSFVLLRPLHWRRPLTAVGLAFANCALTACTLPYEQLMLPSAIDPPTSASPAQPGVTRKGVPLAGASTTAGEAQIITGSGDFLGTGGRVTQVSGPESWNTNGGGSKGSGGRGGSSGPGSSSNADGITINLVGASVQEVARTVLGDILGVNYIVSDKVKGTVTLRTVRPVDKAGLMEIFDAVLRAEGAAMVVEGGVHKIVPAAEAAAGGAPLRPSRLGRPAVGGMATDIAPLKYVAATEMERILKSAAPAAGVLRVDSSRNLLVLSGTQSELAAMRELINVFDVDSMRGMSFGLFPIETSDPEAIASELDTIFGNDKDGPTKGIVRFIGNKRLKSVLVISARPEYLQKASSWIKRIDRAAKATDKQVHVYHVQHRPANEVANLLQKVYSTGGQRGGTTTSSSSNSSTTRTSTSPDGGLGSTSLGSTTGIGSTGIGSSGTGSSGIGGSASGGGTGVAPAVAPGFGSATTTPVTQQPVASSDPITTGSVGGGSQLVLDDRSAGIQVVADEQNNTIVITATASEYRRIRTILQAIDAAGTQVLIEATLAEVTLNDELKMGVRWFFQKGANSVSQSDAAGTSFGALTGAATNLLPGFSYVFNSLNIKAVINALSTVSDVNIISSPTLMVTENKKATLQVGNDVPILTQASQSTQGGNAPIVNSVTYRSTGVILNITPRVADDGRVLLDIEQESSDIAGGINTGINSPAFVQRKVKTTVTVRDGETIILAGFIQDKAQKDRAQLPIFGDIPVIGNLFKTKDDKIDRTELLISITPNVIRDDSQIAAVTSEFRDSINLSTRPQRKTGPEHREQFDRIIR